MLWLDKDCKIRNSEDVDKLVYIEIRDQNIHQKLYKIIKKHVIHGPCRAQNTKSPCMDRTRNICTKNCPKDYCFTTNYITNGYPLYRRRNNERVITYG